MAREMDGKESQGQDRGQPQGKPPTPILEWVEAQQLRLQEDQQQEDQQQRSPPPPLQSQLPLRLGPAPHVQGFNYLGPAGAWPYAFGFPGAAGSGQPQRRMPSMFAGHEAPFYYDYNVIPGVFAPHPYGPGHLPPPHRYVNNGAYAGFPNIPPHGQPPLYQPNLSATAGNQGTRHGAGAVGHPAQVAQAQGNRHPHNAAPRDEAPNSPARAQQASGEQRPQKRPAEGKPHGEQPASKKHAGRVPVPAGKAPASAAEQRMTVAERLDRGLVTDAADLTKQEIDELLLWARRKKIRWAKVRKDFKFKCAESTLRGRHRNLVKKAPKKPVFSERDLELLPEAIESIAGGPVYDPKKCKVSALWVKAAKYIAEHGGTTSAGPGTLKKKYKALTQGPSSATNNEQKKGKVTETGKGGKGGNAQGSQKKEPTAATPAEQLGAEWNHAEYAQYDVEPEEGADFGEQAVIKEEDLEEEELEEEEPEEEEEELESDPEAYDEFDYESESEELESDPEAYDEYDYDSEDGADSS